MPTSDSCGVVFNIQRCSLHDGPGVRTTVFLKGCPLRCAWCQNPEGLAASPSYLYDSRKCIACHGCDGLAPAAAAAVCPTGAREACGKTYTLTELVDELLIDAPFFQNEGGVTFSGGECLLQSAFVTAAARALKERGISVAIDTCGAVDWSALEGLLSYADLFLYDVKTVDEERHKAFTGRSNRQILDNFARLAASGARIWVRVPVVGGFNATPADARAIRAYLDGFPAVEKVEALRYHELGRHKYDLLNLPYPLGDTALVDDATFAEIKAVLEG